MTNLVVLIGSYHLKFYKFCLEPHPARLRPRTSLLLVFSGTQHGDLHTKCRYRNTDRQTPEIHAVWVVRTRMGAGRLETTDDIGPQFGRQK